MCGEEKSKKDDKTASTPLVTVSDLQRMKQFEVIILRMRKQPFKTKFTPYYKLNWGKKYPPAKYPTRPKQEVHTFDIKEFVKSQKKKKLLEMMNSADEADRENSALTSMGGVARPNPFHDQLPPELQAVRERKRPVSDEEDIPDFLRREKAPASSKPASSGIPTFEEFKKQMEEEGAFNPFVDDESPKKETPKIEPNPKNVKEDDDDFDDDLGFDVDELVKKIDAKIAELEEEEKRNKEQEEKKQASKEVPKLSEEKPTKVEKVEKVQEEKKEESKASNLQIEDDDDDDFFDDFFDN